MIHFFDGVSTGILQGRDDPNRHQLHEFRLFFLITDFCEKIHLFELIWFDFTVLIADAIRLLSEGIPASASVFRGSVRGFSVSFSITWVMSSVWVTTYCLSCFKRVARLE
jgi:uncharacterized membrane protein (DUF485 family)